MERLVSFKAIKRYDFVLTDGDDAEQGHIAFGDPATGMVTITPGGIALGLFAATMTGDGVAKITVALWDEIFAYWFDNDTGTPVVAADMFKPAYAVSDVAVSTAGTVELGVILDLDATQGVLVYATMPASALVAGP